MATGFNSSQYRAELEADMSWRDSKYHNYNTELKKHTGSVASETAILRSKDSLVSMKEKQVFINNLKAKAGDTESVYTEILRSYISVDSFSRAMATCEYMNTIKLASEAAQQRDRNIKKFLRNHTKVRNKRCNPRNFSLDSTEFPALGEERTSTDAAPKSIKYKNKKDRKTCERKATAKEIEALFGSSRGTLRETLRKLQQEKKVISHIVPRSIQGKKTNLVASERSHINDEIERLTLLLGESQLEDPKHKDETCSEDVYNIISTEREKEGENKELIDSNNSISRNFESYVPRTPSPTPQLLSTPPLTTYYPSSLDHCRSKQKDASQQEEKEDAVVLLHLQQQQQLFQYQKQLLRQQQQQQYQQRGFNTPTATPPTNYAHKKQFDTEGRAEANNYFASARKARTAHPPTRAAQKLASDGIQKKISSMRDVVHYIPPSSNNDSQDTGLYDIINGNNTNEAQYQYRPLTNICNEYEGAWPGNQQEYNTSFIDKIPGKLAGNHLYRDGSDLYNTQRWGSNVYTTFSNPPTPVTGDDFFFLTATQNPFNNGDFGAAATSSQQYL